MSAGIIMGNVRSINVVSAVVDLVFSCCPTRGQRSARSDC